MLMAPSPACFQAAYGMPSGPGADALAIRIALIMSFLRGVQSSGLALHGGPSSYAALSHCLVCLWLVSLLLNVRDQWLCRRSAISVVSVVIFPSSSTMAPRLPPAPGGRSRANLAFFRVAFAHVESWVLVFFGGLVDCLLFLLLCFVDGHFVEVGECQVLEGLCSCGL